MGRFPKVPPLRTNVSEAPGLFLLSYGVVGCGVWALRCWRPYLQYSVPLAKTGIPLEGEVTKTTGDLSFRLARVVLLCIGVLLILLGTAVLLGGLR
jgi:hypothetical protein